MSLSSLSVPRLREEDRVQVLCSCQTSRHLVGGDTPLDVSCAKAVGCSVVAVVTGNYGVDELKTCEPDFVCSRLPDGMDFIKCFLEG